MEARLRSLPTPAATPATTVRLEGDRIVVERLALLDPGLAAFVADRPVADRPALVERALKIGLTALQDAGVTVNVDVIRREFEGLLKQSEAASERAAAALEQTLRLNFADGDGRLPRTLERFLGDRGQLQTFVGDLFDETKRDSAIGRIGGLLGTYFDGDASKLARLIDPTRLGSPMYQFREEISAGFAQLNDRLTSIEAAGAARASERARSSAKGADFEDLLEAMLGDLSRGTGDVLDRTTAETGDVIKSKKGDFVLTLDPRLTGGADLRVVIEAKDRVISGPSMRDELREAIANRRAAVGVVVFTPTHAPAGIAPFDVRAGNVYCVVDPAAPDRATLEAAIRLARLHALATLHEREAAEINTSALRAALTSIREQLDAVRGLKMQVTSISTTSAAVNAALDKLREGILGKVADAEIELRPAR
jgi:hypothetical protein